MIGQPKPCRNCGNIYQPTEKRKCFCSDKCLGEWKRKREVGKRPKPRACILCGRMFQPDAHHFKLCSDWCKNERHKDQEARLYFENAEKYKQNRKNKEWTKTKKQTADQYDRITELAEEKGVSVRELFKRCGLSYNISSKFESGEASLGLKSLQRISEHTDKTINWLIGLE